MKKCLTAFKLVFDQLCFPNEINLLIIPCEDHLLLTTGSSLQFWIKSSDNHGEINLHWVALWVIWFWGAGTCMTKHAGIHKTHRACIAPFSLFTNGLYLSPIGSFSGSASTEASSATAATDSADQVSPTLPRATKHRVSGKLRRSASAISKSSAWALSFTPRIAFNLMITSTPWLQDFVRFSFNYVSYKQLERYAIFNLCVNH